MRLYLVRPLFIGTSLCYFTAWLWCLIVLAITWGTLPVIVGLLLGIVGVVPVALALMMFSGQWSLAISTVLMLVAAILLRMSYLYFKRSAQQMEVLRLLAVNAMATVNKQPGQEAPLQGQAKKTPEGDTDQATAGVNKVWDGVTKAYRDDPDLEVPY